MNVFISKEFCVALESRSKASNEVEENEFDSLGGLYVERGYFGMSLQ
jgi:hypothetical protein